jgi:hypothetical protein
MRSKWVVFYICCVYLLWLFRFKVSLDGSNQRMDKLTRVELHRGSVEFPASTAYHKRRITRSVNYVFAIDITQSAAFSGVTTAAIVAARENIRLLYNRLVSASAANGGVKQTQDVDIRVAVITFNSRIQFYEVNGKFACDWV